VDGAGGGTRRADRRRRAGFDFVSEGRFQREAELFRYGFIVGRQHSLSWDVCSGLLPLARRCPTG
jgi:hypothetical protein